MTGSDSVSKTDPPGENGITVKLSPEDFALVLTALRVLLSTLGREEADELEQVRDLLGRLERVER
jgi:hypothetical protein